MFKLNLSISSTYDYKIHLSINYTGMQIAPVPHLSMPID